MLSLQFRPLSDYKKIDKLGKGAYGEVYKYEKEKDKYAIKKVRNTASKIDTSLLIESVFLKDICCHPNIVKLVDIFIDSYQFALVLELADADLKIYNFKNVKSQTKALFDLCYSVALCHQYNIIHGDIKIQNVLIKDQVLMLADFGVSQDSRRLKLNNRLYILQNRAPELIFGQEVTPKADVWALGCTISRLLSGEILFNGVDEREVLELIFRYIGYPDEDEYPGITKFIRQFNLLGNFGQNVFLSKNPKPESFTDLISKMLVANPENRISSQEILNHPFFRKFTPEKIEPENTLPIWKNLNKKVRSDFANYLFFEERNVIVKYIVELDLSFDTKFLAIAIFDSFVSQKQNPKEDYLKIAYSSIYLALKFDFLLEENTILLNLEVSLEEIVNLGIEILKTLEFNLRIATLNLELSKYKNFYSKEISNLLIELSLSCLFRRDIYQIDYEVLIRSIIKFVAQKVKEEQQISILYFSGYDPNLVKEFK